MESAPGETINISAWRAQVMNDKFLHHWYHLEKEKKKKEN